MKSFHKDNHWDSQYQQHWHHENSLLSGNLHENRRCPQRGHSYHIGLLRFVHLQWDDSGVGRSGRYASHALCKDDLNLLWHSKTCIRNRPSPLHPVDEVLLSQYCSCYSGILFIIHETINIIYVRKSQYNCLLIMNKHTIQPLSL